MRDLTPKEFRKQYDEPDHYQNPKDVDHRNAKIWNRIGWFLFVTITSFIVHLLWWASQV